jgi:hypothetical protein
MHLPTMDLVLWTLTMAGEVTLVIFLLTKGMGRHFPIFTSYMIFNLIEDPLAWVLNSTTAPEVYARFYFAVTLLDSLLQLLVLFEIGRNVLRPSRKSLPFPILPVATVVILICAIIAASFSPAFTLTSVRHGTEVFLRITLGLAVLKVLLFAALAGFSQLLGIGWKNRVFQLATGLAFYGVASLFVQLTIRHLQTANYPSYVSHFVVLTQIQSAAYVGTLVLWIWAFSRNEAPRKDFTPQMQEVLVTIAETAKRTRLAVTRSTDRR